MKYIKIDVFKREVYEVATLAGENGLHFLYRHLHCDCITAAVFHWPDSTLYVDDEGMLKPVVGFFVLEGLTNQPLAGNGMICGVDEEGNDIESTIPLAEVKRRVEFMGREEVLEYLRKNEEDSD